VEASAQYDRSRGGVMGYNELVLGARGMIEELRDRPADLFEAFVIPKQYCDKQCAQEVIQKRDSYDSSIPIVTFDAYNFAAPFQAYEEPGMEEVRHELVNFHEMGHDEARAVWDKHLEP